MSEAVVGAVFIAVVVGLDLDPPPGWVVRSGSSDFLVVESLSLCIGTINTINKIDNEINTF